jgi:hypothetical protein
VTTKNIFTISLLMFVAAGVVVLTVKSLRLRQRPESQVAIRDGVMVYYFHTNTRCPTCENIETYARDAVESGFADQLKNKEIVWQVINYEKAGNEHYATDYELVAPNVVLAMFRGGKQVKWESLPEVWEHVGDKPVFIDFVQTSIRDFLSTEKQSQ